MTENQIFERIDYTQNNLSKGEYENCRFLNCNFHKGDLLNITFRECEFYSCDFSLAQIKNTSLNDVQFIGCKLLGVQFDDCNTFLMSFQFENSLLKLAQLLIIVICKEPFSTKRY
jgi:fluoroquinolone resistance protein